MGVELMEDVVWCGQAGLTAARIRDQNNGAARGWQLNDPKTWQILEIFLKGRSNA
jgi:hypothetical protein